MRKMWLGVLILGLLLCSPGLGLGQPEAQKKPPAAPAAPGGKPGAAAEKGAPVATTGAPTEAGTAAGAATAAGTLPPALTPPVPLAPPPALPRPVEFEVLDVPNDNGTAVGVVWKWQGDVTADDKVTIETEVPAAVLDRYRLTAAEQQRLDAARAELAAAVAPLVGPRDAAAEALGAADDALAKAQVEHASNLVELMRAKWAASNQLDTEQKKIDRQRDTYMKRVGKLDEKEQKFDYLQATLAKSPWVVTNIENQDAASFGTKADSPDRFGNNPEEPDKLYAEVNQIRALNPAVATGTYEGKPDQYDQTPPPSIMIDLDKNVLHNLRMVVTRKPAPPAAAAGTAASAAAAPVAGALAAAPAPPQVFTEATELGGAVSKVNYFNFAVLNNLIFSVLFAVVILSAIVLARRNPNLFIRRISGLEAVDEAIGRATEMGKPILYICGLDPLSALNTLAAINILGRVARRIADYDSDLIVPCRDPVLMTVAQEVVRDSYIEQGRPDAYREDKIWFVTDDQFAYTAATCGIMVREKPAANFFMGGYYAESLLLAETGASTGAIQIAGTDSLSQLPFFITTCDYTLIGEELYAASAYLSREPMLLGSLKGQDVGKALVMILILVQTLLFIVSAILAKMQIVAPLDFLRNLVQPL